MRNVLLGLSIFLIAFQSFAQEKEGEKRYGDYFIGGTIDYELLEAQNWYFFGYFTIFTIRKT